MGPCALRSGKPAADLRISPRHARWDGLSLGGPGGCSDQRLSPAQPAIPSPTANLAPRTPSRDREGMTAWALLPLLVGSPWVSPVTGASIQADFRPAAAYATGHRGVDLAATTGTSVRAVADATVVLAGPVAGKPVVVLLVEHPSLGSVRVTYEPVTPHVEVGEHVLAGQLIGTLAGAGGHCGDTPHCLHLGIKQNGRYLNPIPVLRSDRVVLKMTS